jgi:hypothetical protein
MLAGNERLMGMNYYVTMTEIYYSRSKQSKGKIAKFIFICDFYNEAEVVADNARQIGTMDSVSICTTRPHYTRYNHYRVCQQTDLAKLVYPWLLLSKKSDQVRTPV